MWKEGGSTKRKPDKNGCRCKNPRKRIKTIAVCVFVRRATVETAFKSVLVPLLPFAQSHRNVSVGQKSENVQNKSRTL